MPLRRRPLNIPTTLALPHSIVLPPTSRTVLRALTRLSRASLIALALDWLLPRNSFLCAPYLLPPGNDPEDVEEDDLFPAAASIQELREMYEEMREKKGAKRRVLDRMLEGDWRRGVTLYQVAMADMRCLEERGGIRWTGMKLVRVSKPPIAEKDTSDEQSSLPRFHAPTFIRNLQKEISPIIKAHFYLASSPITTSTAKTAIPILRLALFPTPYNQSSPLSTLSSGSANPDKFLPPSQKVIYIALPPCSPYVYISISPSTATALQPIPSTKSTSISSSSLTSLLISAIPRAISRPHHRYKLEPTNFTTKNLSALLHARSGASECGAQGGWGIYADQTAESTPLATISHNSQKRARPTNPATQHSMLLRNPFSTAPNPTPSITTSSSLPSKHSNTDNRSPTTHKCQRLQSLAHSRFGNSGVSNDDGRGIERFAAILTDAFDFTSDKPPEGAQLRNADATPSHAVAFKPRVKLVFHGTHVFAGMRRLVEEGVLDGLRLPGWMTGEAGVTGGVVKDGRMGGWDEFS